MSLPTFHDTIRHLIRSMAFRDEASQRDALLAVDAHERQFGTSDTDAHVAELAAQAAAAAPPTAEQLALRAQASAEERARELEAENTRLQALVTAQTRPSGVTGTPATTGPE